MLQAAGLQGLQRRFKLRQIPSIGQLRGDANPSTSDCDPLIYEDPEATPRVPLNPCGLIANSKFSDVITLAAPSGAVVPLRKDGIAWKSDKEKTDGPS